MKKICSFITFLVTLLMVTNSVISADFMYGDGDNNSKITSTDAALTIKNSLIGN